MIVNVISQQQAALERIEGGSEVGLESITPALAMAAAIPH